MERFKNIFKKNGLEIFKLSFIIFIIIFPIIMTARELKSINFVEIIMLVKRFSFLLILVLALLAIIFTLIIQSKSENKLVENLRLNRFKEIIGQTSGLTNLLLSILVLFSGIVLLTSALVPGAASRIKLAAKLMSFPILQWSHQLSISIGVLLITISRDINMKVKRAYKFTWWLLLFGAIFTFLKGFDYEEAIFLTIVLALLRMSKESFYRRSLPFDRFWTLITSVLALIGIIIYMKLSHVILLDYLKLRNFRTLISQGFSNFKISGFITYSSFIGFLIYRELTKERIIHDERYETLDEDKLKDFLLNNGGSFMSHLLFLNDKHIFWSKSGKVIIAFEKSHNVIIALGDPIGNREYFGEAIDEFQKFIDEYGFKSVFYEASGNLLSLYHDHGYYFFKLGETALVSLENFDISSSKSRDFRNVLSRFKRDGYYFEVIDGKSLEDNLYYELLNISNEWLGERKEMGFSLGFMDRKYLKHSPLGLIKKVATNEIIAFASLMPKYDEGKSVSIDLMRFKKDVPSNTMTYLILNLMMYLKENNFEILNLGMAPLSNVGRTSNAHPKEKIANLVFKYGNNIYSFDGLRKYKEKFSPQWESRYLAYEDLSLLPASLIEATILIHSHNK